MYMEEDRVFMSCFMLSVLIFIIGMSIVLGLVFSNILLFFCGGLILGIMEIMLLAVMYVSKKADHDMVRYISKHKEK